MLSRVAEDIYWMARHIERAENTARIITVNTHLLLDLPKRVRLGWGPIIDITGSRELYDSLYREIDERRAIRFLAIDTNNPSSILSALSYARENARTIRDIIPREAWEQLNQMYLYAKSESSRVLVQKDRFEYLRNVILGAQTMTGMLAGTMTHDEGYHFLRLGRNLERADMTTRILDVRTASLLPADTGELVPFENIQWMSVLKSLSGYQMYRRTVRMRVSREDALKFLLQERDFPRAFYHAVCEVESALQSLPNNAKPVKAVNRLQQLVLRAKPEKLSQQALHGFIDDLQAGLAGLNDELVNGYFLSNVSPDVIPPESGNRKSGSQQA